MGLHVQIKTWHINLVTGWQWWTNIHVYSGNLLTQILLTLSKIWVQWKIYHNCYSYTPRIGQPIMWLLWWFSASALTVSNCTYIIRARFVTCKCGSCSAHTCDVTHTRGEGMIHFSCRCELNIYSVFLIAPAQFCNKNGMILWVCCAWIPCLTCCSWN